jgi:hypothetical protein
MDSTPHRRMILKTTKCLCLARLAAYSHKSCYISQVLPQLHLSISLSDRVLVGAALSREFIAHECAPTEISNMFD